MIDNLVIINLDKERHLRLTLKGMVEFDKLTGRNLLKGFNLKDLTMEDTATLLWACLIHEDKELAFDDVLNMVDLSNLMQAVEAITACITQSFSSKEVKDKSPLVKKTTKSQRG